MNRKEKAGPVAAEPASTAQNLLEGNEMSRQILSSNKSASQKKFPLDPNQIGNMAMTSHIEACGYLQGIKAPWTIIGVDIPKWERLREGLDDWSVGQMAEAAKSVGISTTEVFDVWLAASEAAKRETGEFRESRSV